MEINSGTQICKHYVKRKKRYCKMLVLKGKEYCPEHDIKEDLADYPENCLRLQCPLDPKHTVYKHKLQKHLKICNARPQITPNYLESGVNEGNSDNEDNNDYVNIKLSEINSVYLTSLINKIKKIYELEIKEKIKPLYYQHKVLNEKISNKTYGMTTRKHLVQTSSILGILEAEKMLKDNTTFIEFGAGKGQVAFWLNKVLLSYSNCNTILIDKMSHRHKKDNKLNKNIVSRIRADIANLKLKNLNLLENTKRIVCISKHLCGSATDLTLRCIINNLMNENNIQIEAFIIALCCHHQCNWKSFVGKEFFRKNDLNRKDFELIIKMVSWAVCGTGLSRETRKLIAERNSNGYLNELKNDNTSSIIFSHEEKEKIGKMCKAIINYSRLLYMEYYQYECTLNYYCDSNVTLENVSLKGILKNKMI